MRILITVLFLFSPALSFAFFCPGNFNQIDLGNSPEQVASICGKPDKVEVTEEPAPVPQEWSYFIPQTMPTGESLSGQQPATMKAQITFDDKGNAINISINGVGVTSTTACGNTAIQTGDNIEAVRKACGKPSFINKQDSSLSGDLPPKKITTYTYATTPPSTITFENGKLTKSRK